ncbi:GNAT family N-acyltransferase [Albidovulum sp.]
MIAPGAGTVTMARGRYRFVAGHDAGLRRRALALRGRAFRGGAADDDPFDPLFAHAIVEERAGGRTLAALRCRLWPRAEAAREGYAASLYALDELLGRGRGPVLEIGRLCLAEGAGDPDVARLIWAALTRQVDAAGVALLIGCASLPGADPDRWADSLGVLAGHARPLPLAARRGGHPLAASAARPGFDPARGLRQMPSLLRFYLAMGAWFGDRAAIDHDLGTLHLFTAVEVARVPPARARALRLLAHGAP